MRLVTKYCHYIGFWQSEWILLFILPSSSSAKTKPNGRQNFYIKNGLLDILQCDQIEHPRLSNTRQGWDKIFGISKTLIANLPQHVFIMTYDSTFFMNTFSRSQLCYEHFFLRFRLAIRCSQIATALRSIARLCARALVGSYLPETLTQQVEVGSLLLSSLTETRIDTRLEPEVHIIVSLLTMYYLIVS